MLLAGAKRAYNEKNYPFAADRFREFLAKYGGHKDANAARYGLALCLLDGPDQGLRQGARAAQPARRPEGVRRLPVRPLLPRPRPARPGRQGARAGRAKPNEAPQHRNAAAALRRGGQELRRRRRRLRRQGQGRQEPREGPRRRTGVGRPGALRPGRDAAAPPQGQGGPRGRRRRSSPTRSSQASRYLPLAAYYHGFACFLLGDTFAAGKSLSRESVLADDGVRHPRPLPARPRPPPQHQAERARGGPPRLQGRPRRPREGEEGRPREAAPGRQLQERPRGPGAPRTPRPRPRPRPRRRGRRSSSASSSTRTASSPRRSTTSRRSPRPTRPRPWPEAQLRMGFCQVQLKQFDDAIKTLQPLADKEPALADQALLDRPGREEQGRPAQARHVQAVPRDVPQGRRARRSSGIAADPRARTAARPDPRRPGRDAAAGQGVPRRGQHLHADPQREAPARARGRDAPQPGDGATSSPATTPRPRRSCDDFLQRHKAARCCPPSCSARRRTACFQAVAAEKLPNPADRSARRTSSTTRR